MDRVDYEKSVEFGGDPARALEVARDVFVQKGFRIVELSDSGFEVTGGRGIVTRFNPLDGASRVRMTVIGRELLLQVNLGRIRQKWYLHFMILYLPISSLLYFATLMIFYWEIGRSRSSNLFLVELILPWPFILPWLYIIPFATRIKRRRTLQALETLLHNAAMIGGAGKVR